jgi:hypothetical protein
MSEQDFVKNLSDDELQQWIDTAYADCEKEANIEKESDDHIAAFAGLMTLVFEARDRGLHLKRMH